MSYNGYMGFWKIFVIGTMDPYDSDRDGELASSG